MTEPLCGCIRCHVERVSEYLKEHPESGGFGVFATPGFRYACEKCGNKRCPHHTDHRLECTGSNEPGQKGSVYEGEA